MYPAFQNNGELKTSSLRQEERTVEQCAAGTVLQGSVATGGTVEIGAGREHRKVKSLQRFHEPCTRISCGDRAGLCVTKFAASGVERTWVSAPKLLRVFRACVCLVQRCRFYTCAGSCPSSSCSTCCKYGR